jgi:hypothetical protein
MTRMDRMFGWMPALFVGAAAAVAAEVAIGILLYADTGLMRSLSTVLVIELAAFAAGLWAAPTYGPQLTDVLRRRWVMCLIAFLGAAIFGTSWTVVRELGTGAVGQGMGLAILAAFPLYTTGGVLGGLAVANTHDPRGPLPGIGAPAAFGAAIGFGAAGVMLPRAPMPSSLLIACLVVLSLGGLIFGVVLGARPQTVLRGERSTVLGDVRVEDRNSKGEGGSARVLLEGSQVRRALRLDEAGDEPWDVAVARALMPASEEPWRVLALGGGPSSLPLAVVREHPTAQVHVLERVPEVVELGREFFDTALEIGETERQSVRVGNLDDLIGALDSPYDLIVVDCDSLASLGGPRGLSRRSRDTLVSSVSPTGVLVWGPRLDGVGEPDAGWEHRTLQRETAITDREQIRFASRVSLSGVESGFGGFISTAEGLAAGSVSEEPLAADDGALGGPVPEESPAAEDGALSDSAPEGSLASDDGVAAEERPLDL